MPDAHQSESRLGQLPFVCLLLFIAVTPRAVANESLGQISSTDITRSVVSSLPQLQGKSADVIAHMDLTQPFETQTQWTFVAAILPGSLFSGAEEQPVDGGELAECFIDKLASHCRYKPQNDSDRYSTPIELYSAKVVFADANNTRPLLLIKTGSAHAANGGHSIFTELFTYDRQLNEFQSVFSNATSSNNNQETRFIEEGPLRGDVIVAVPTSSAPFGFWISVYAWNTKDGYSRSTLRYRSATHYGDGNPLAVIDSEMPGIFRRMGLWRPGDPLPAPPGCSRPVLRHGEQWCQ
jgi:hypothetical protein